MPRRIEMNIMERGLDRKRYVRMQWNGVNIGDRLTDNKTEPDDYRFHDVCVLSAKVRNLVRRLLFVSRFDSEEQLVPFVMFARGGRATTGKGLVEQPCIGDMVGLHPAPVGERTAA